MGISIHYQGRLDDLSLIVPLMDELEDIAKSIGWSSRRLDEDWTLPCTAKLVHSAKGAEITGDLCLKGIILSPDDNTESLPFLFNAEGSMRSLLGAVGDPQYAGIVSVKTQFGGTRTHTWIIGLLKYIQSKYVSNLQVTDEGGVWEGGSEKELNEKRALISGFINAFEKRIWAAESKSSNPSELLKKIEAIAEEIHKDQKKKEPPEQ